MDNLMGHMVDSGTATSLNNPSVISTLEVTQFVSSVVTEKNNSVEIPPEDKTTSTVIQSSKHSQGWVDKAKILTNSQFIQKLKANLK